MNSRSARRCALLVNAASRLNPCPPTFPVATGAQDRKRTNVTVNTTEGAGLMNAMVHDGVLLVEPVTEEGRAIRRRLLDLKTEASWRYRRRQFETDLADAGEQMNTCPQCGECM
ncbi:MAG TPA: hypothetical protein VIN62_01535, partial [Candidatus Cryosericum sp.]